MNLLSIFDEFLFSNHLHQKRDRDDVAAALVASETLQRRLDMAELERCRFERKLRQRDHFSHDDDDDADDDDDDEADIDDSIDVDEAEDGNAKAAEVADAEVEV